MKTPATSRILRMRYHPNAYRFLFAALKHTQDHLGRSQARGEEQAHISGKELVFGIRDFARSQFGLMALAVFRTWGVRSTRDFGNMVFELIEQGKMRKTPRDQLSDFFDVYDFEEAFDRDYQLDVSGAFAPQRSTEHVEL